ncbi:DUF6931 family protein [Bryobacter aggregatus]|uniref:DUF6931 family protein n=1 Tax=Bryobacter aggregatus TaxID=360054 RepID=UPI0004E0D621|nr:hypothetical protein [Bryobacter aggregatus]
MIAKTTSDIVKYAMLKPPATHYLPHAQDARHYAELLVQNNLWMPALNYMSHAIPPREGVWWAWFCARKAVLPTATPEEIQALQVAETWIAKPTDENRFAARDYAALIPSGSPPQCVLEAIAFLGELEDPVTGNKSPAIPYMSSKFIAAAVVGAAYSPDPEKPDVTAKEYLAQSFEVANRINLWSQYS